MKLGVLCPAKINLFLAVGPPDATGYHPVRTVMQAISLYDDLEVEFGGQGFEVVGAGLPEDNSVSKALRLSREVLALPPVGIRLVKQIPIEAGLGGGSSDAAGLLRALTRYQSRVSVTELSSIATAIGVDTPFFLVGGRARAEHYGEQVIPLPDAPVEWYVVAKPEAGCASGAMYAALDGQERDWREWPETDSLYNDFERVAPAECRDLIERLRGLGARDAGLTGSGSAVFGRFDSEARAESAANSMADVRHWIARSLTRSESLRVERR